MNNKIKNYTFSLRQFLAYPFLALFLFIVSVLVLVFYENSMRMGRQMEQQLALVLNGHVSHHLDQIFAEPVNAVNTINTLYRSGKLQSRDAEDQAHQLATIMSTMPDLTTLDFCFEDEHCVGVKRSLVDGKLQTFVQSQTSTPSTPNKEAQWNTVYRHISQEKSLAYGRIGLGYSMPALDAHENIIGVISSDISLEQISRYLKLLPLGEGGVAFITNDKNQIVGTSTDTPLFALQKNSQDSRATLHLVQADTDESELIRAASEHVLHKGIGSSYIRVEDANYVQDVREFTSTSGLKLRVVVLLPEAQFFPAIQSYLTSMLVVVIVALIIGVVLVFIIAHRLSKPMVRITYWAKQLASGNWELLRQPNDSELKDYPIKEIRLLRNTFSDMAASLYETVATLEERVAERTAELEELNAHLSILSNTDGLTDIANRRRFDEVLASEWSRATRSGQPLVLALIDVDWFKNYNDHYGHLAGDQSLRKVADILKAKVRRSSDLVARYGGEEFAIIAPGINHAKALEVMNMICSTIAQAEIPHDLSPFGIVTASIGVAIIYPDLDSQPEVLIKAADEALYRAKEGGRNQVVCADIVSHENELDAMET